MTERIPRTNDMREVDRWRMSVGEGAGEGGCMKNVTIQSTPVLPTNPSATNTANLKTIIANTSSGEALFFPAGEYLFAKDGDNPYAILINKNISFFGPGIGAKLKAMGTNFDLIRVINLTQIIISNLCLTRDTLVAYSSSFTNYFAGLCLSGCNTSVFTNLCVSNHGFGIRLLNTDNSTVNSGNSFHNIAGINNRVGIFFTNTTSHQPDNFFHTCSMVGDETYTTDGTGYNAGLYIEGVYAGDIWVTNCVFLRVERGVSIHFTGSSENYRYNVNLVNVWIDVCKNYGFYFRNMHLIRLNNCSTVGNGVGIHFQNCSVVGITQTYIGVYQSLTSAIDIYSGGLNELSHAYTISNNHIAGNSSYSNAIRLYGVHLSSIIGNNIVNTINGIRLFQDIMGSNSICYKNTISANSIRNSQTGIHLTSTTNLNVVTANVLYGQSIPIIDEGTQNIIEANSI